MYLHGGEEEGEGFGVGEGGAEMPGSLVGRGEVCWLDGVVGMRSRSSQELYVVASKKEKNFWLEGLDSIPPDSATLSVDGR